MQSLIQTVLYLLTVFLPLTFTTINSELFEFPKFILLLSGTLILVAAWLIDHFYYKNQSLHLSRSHSTIHLSIFAILITQALATITSIHPYTSFWGYYSRFHQGLLTTICYTVIYFMAVKYLDNKSTQKIIKISINTAIVISLYAIFQRFGIDKNLWIQDVVNRPFSTLGQPNWLASYLLPNLFLALSLLHFHHNQSRSRTLLHYSSYFLILVALFFTRSRSGLLAFLMSYGVYYFLLIRQFSLGKLKHQFITTTLTLIVAALVAGTAYTPSLKQLVSRINPTPTPPPTGTQLENGGTESGDIRQIVWSGTLELIKKYPLFGTGPETFAYTYYWVRPLAHNQTSEWDFLYNKAHNEYLNIAATTGIIGLLSYLFFHYAVFGFSLTRLPRSKKTNQILDDQLRHYYPVLGANIVGFAITNFFGFSVIPVYFLMILLAALASSIHRQTANNPSPVPPAFYLLVLILLLYPLQLFLADKNYATGKAYLEAGQTAAALPLLLNATSIRPAEALYHSTLGDAYAQLGQKELALDQAELTQHLNPHHLNYHKARAKIYLTLAESDPALYERAASEIKAARTLAPTDPKLAYNLGLIYTRLGNNQEAQTELELAQQLKPDYESPYYALTLLYEQTNQKDLIPNLLNLATTHLATYSSALHTKINQYHSVKISP